MNQIDHLKMTPRNWINLGVITFALGACIASRFGYSLDGLDVATTQATAIGFVIGALLPGSPLGRVLDYVASLFGGPPAPPPSVADIDAIRTRRPVRVPPSSSSPVTVAAYAVLAAVLGLTGSALLAHGCGPALSDAQRSAYVTETLHCQHNEREIADRTGTTLAEDEADLAAERARCNEARDAIEHPPTTTVDGGL